MKIGYARVSTAEQNLEIQIQQLEQNGCEKIFTDVASGVKTNRNGLTELMAFARTNDTIVIVRLDRLGRSLKELISLANELKQANIELISLAENIDTTTTTGQLVFNIFATLADFERNLIIDRTQAGLKVARARGRFGGRPRLLTPSQIAKMAWLYESKKFTVNEIAKEYGITRATMYRYLNEFEAMNKQQQNTKGTLL